MNMLTTTNRLGSKPDNLSVAFYRFTCGNITNGNFMTGGDIAEGFQLFFRKPVPAATGCLAMTTSSLSFSLSTGFVFIDIALLEFIG